MAEAIRTADLGDHSQSFSEGKPPLHTKPGETLPVLQWQQQSLTDLGEHSQSLTSLARLVRPPTNEGKLPPMPTWGNTPSPHKVRQIATFQSFQLPGLNQHNTHHHNNHTTTPAKRPNSRLKGALTGHGPTPNSSGTRKRPHGRESATQPERVPKGGRTPTTVLPAQFCTPTHQLNMIGFSSTQ